MRTAPSWARNWVSVLESTVSRRALAGVPARRRVAAGVGRLAPEPGLELPHREEAADPCDHLAGRVIQSDVDR